MSIRRRRRNPAIWILLFVMAVTAAMLAALEGNLREAAVVMAEYRSRNTATAAMTKGIEEVVERFDGVPLVNISGSDEDGIRSVQVDVQAVNRFKIQVTEQILENLRQAGLEEAEIPLGTLLGSGLLAGRGPALRYRFLSEGSVTTRVISSFESCGVNQTRHQLLLSVEVHASAILSRYQVEVEAPTEYVLAETVLLGGTPENYTQVITDGRDLLGDINDYKAGEELEISQSP